MMSWLPYVSSVVGVLALLVSVFVALRAGSWRNSDELKLIDKRFLAVENRVSTVEGRMSVAENRIDNEVDRLEGLLKRLEFAIQRLEGAAMKVG